MCTVSEDAAQIISDAVPNLPQDDFQKLISDLSMALAPASGLRCDDVDVDELIRLMENYTSKEEEWQRYALADFNLGYTRNLVDEGNGKSNLLILVWSPGKGSPIHDHADAHCVMKILKGSLKETIYSWPDRNLTGDGKPSPPEMKRESIYRQGQVNYMSDELGLHSITNLDPSDVAVSLHLYTPPHAARVGAHIYDERTGKSSHVLQSNYYSVHGIYTDNI